jgi:hypothetical protein
MLAIEKNRELPKIRVRNSYPYKVMEVGDSFFVEDTSLQVICNSNYRMGKQLGVKFIARKEKDGVRVWRTE